MDKHLSQARRVSSANESCTHGSREQCDSLCFRVRPQTQHLFCIASRVWATGSCHHHTFGYGSTPEKQNRRVGGVWWAVASTSKHHWPTPTTVCAELVGSHLIEKRVLSFGCHVAGETMHTCPSFPPLLPNGIGFDGGMAAAPIRVSAGHAHPNDRFQKGRRNRVMCRLVNDCCRNSRLLFSLVESVLSPPMPFAILHICWRRAGSASYRFVAKVLDTSMQPWAFISASARLK